MKPMRMLAVVLLAAVSACTFRPDPDRHARKFFDEGKEMIIEALEKQDATKQQLAAAKAVLAKYDATLPADIAAVMRKQRDMFRGVATGRDSATLVQLEADLHQAHEKTARAIGRMHEEVGAAVGEATWKAAQARLDKRWAKRFDE